MQVCDGRHLLEDAGAPYLGAWQRDAHDGNLLAGHSSRQRNRRQVYSIQCNLRVKPTISFVPTLKLRLNDATYKVNVFVLRALDCRLEGCVCFQLGFDCADISSTACRCERTQARPRSPKSRECFKSTTRLAGASSWRPNSRRCSPRLALTQVR